MRDVLVAFVKHKQVEEDNETLLYSLQLVDNDKLLIIHHSKTADKSPDTPLIQLPLEKRAVHEDGF